MLSSLLLTPLTFFLLLFFLLIFPFTSSVFLTTHFSSLSLILLYSTLSLRYNSIFPLLVISVLCWRPLCPLFWCSSCCIQCLSHFSLYFRSRFISLLSIPSFTSIIFSFLSVIFYFLRCVFFFPILISLLSIFFSYRKIFSLLFVLLYFLLIFYSSPLFPHHSNFLLHSPVSFAFVILLLE